MTPQSPAQPLVPPKSVRPLSGYERSWATAIGVAAAGTGGVATFITVNGVAAAALLGFGAIFLLVGVLGLVPTRFKVGDNEASLERAVTERVVATLNDPGADTAARESARVILTRASSDVLASYTSEPVSPDEAFRYVNEMYSKYGPPWPTEGRRND